MLKGRHKGGSENRMRRGRSFTKLTVPLVLACAARSALAASPLPEQLAAGQGLSGRYSDDLSSSGINLGISGPRPVEIARAEPMESAPIQLALALPPPRRPGSSAVAPAETAAPTTGPAPTAAPAASTPPRPGGRPLPPRPGGVRPSTPGATATPATPGATKAPVAAASAEPRVLPAPPEDEFRLAGTAMIPRPLGATLGRADQIGVNDNFVPVPDRWRIGLPESYVQNVSGGDIYNPYRQNVLKGDYPVLGTQDIFFILGLTSDTLVEARRLPIPSGTSTRFPNRFEFFGRGESQLVNQNFIVSAELFKGDASYQPKDWIVKATAVYNINFAHFEENNLVKADVAQVPHDRTDNEFAMQELFGEKKLADLTSNYDFISVRAGIQLFSSDFRGFLFADSEPGVRLFGNLDNNRIQFNLAAFNQVEKDTNSGLNTFDLRDQQIYIANVFLQDFFFPGYTASFSIHSNWDNSGPQYDRNGFLVRPAPIGTVANKQVQANYLGWAGDGHIGRFNITHQYYYVFGEESYNNIAGQSVDISAQFFAIEVSYDQDYVRYRASFAYAGGDRKPTDGRATGFDTIFDNPNFAGGGMSFFTRQSIALTGAGVNLTGRNSFVPDLRTSKEQGQANFVNPGLFLYNIGADVDVTPKIKFITNASYLQFADTSSLRLLLQDDKIGKDIGVDLSMGFEYRPLLNNNIIFAAGVAALIPAQGFKDLYTSQTLYSTFMALTVTY